MKQNDLPSPVAFQEKATLAAGLLRSLANEHRLMILCRLGMGEQSVGQLQEEFDLSQSALSQHLAMLRRDGIVATRREGQVIHYRIADEASIRVIETLMAIYCPEMLEK
ncbi:MAG: ArsR family transcriptional regulator [Hirschia sp.]|nr:ArsR family transcriptional regulator [Hirschia sp.]MBF18654.1 ArsR family transcriptional regulator [Hirschia sp.]|tara:strand:+ start:138 stop:464 length:327 start_codon:yes stop_codon:yes gene_type:complete